MEISSMYHTYWFTHCLPLSCHVSNFGPFWFLGCLDYLAVKEKTKIWEKRGQRRLEAPKLKRQKSIYEEFWAGNSDKNIGNIYWTLIMCQDLCQSILHISSHIIPKVHLWGSYYYHLHLTPEETVLERSDNLSNLIWTVMVEAEFIFQSHWFQKLNSTTMFLTTHIGKIRRQEGNKGKDLFWSAYR